MKSCHLFIEFLGENFHTNFAAVLGFPKGNLSEGLVSEAIRHHEAWVTRSTSKIHKTTFGKHVDAVPIGKGITINLWLDVEFLDSVECFELGNLNLIIEVTDVTNDGLVFHLLHVLGPDDVEVTSGGDVDVSPPKGVFNGKNTESFHGRLKRTDWINFSHHDLCTLSTEGLGTAFTDIAVSTNNTHLAGNHHIGGALDAVDERFTATVEVIKF